MSLLQELLNAGLVEIGSDDSRFEKMQLAASALATRFKEEPSLLIPATLISLDNDVDENDPIFALIEELVILEWKTLRNTHVNRPRELLRAIAIDALGVATSGNAEAAGVVWDTAASPMRHKQMRLGKAGPIIEKLVKSAAQIAETEAITRTGLAVRTSQKRKPSTVPPDIATLNIEGAIEDGDVLMDVARAAGPQYPQNQALESPNPHWPNAGQPWSLEFTQRMTAALVKTVNLGTGNLAKSVSQYFAGYHNQITEQLREVEQLQDGMSQAHDSSRMRLDVLWWSESLYSPTLQVGYRDLPLPVAAVAAAVDLATVVPALAPASVCYVLGETVLRLARVLNANGDQPIISYLQTLSDAQINLGDGFPRAPTNEGRSPLLDLAEEACTGRAISTEILRSRAGIDGDVRMSSAEFAMWVFRDIQARRLVKALR